jgi:hypothetical protein
MLGGARGRVGSAIVVALVPLSYPGASRGRDSNPRPPALQAKNSGPAHRAPRREPRCRTGPATLMRGGWAAIARPRLSTVDGLEAEPGLEPGCAVLRTAP